MSDQSNDPYSRLQALQRMGIVQDYSIIRNKSIAIVGIGGLGSIAAEMLCRMGCGRLILFDYDSVELANMNRMFFTREQVGMKKTKAAVETLSRLNPDVHVEARDMNVTRLASYEPFKRDVLGVDLLLCTVDNYSARLVVNQVCLETGKQWLESGVSETAISGHIQNMVPGQTACFECAPPLISAQGIDEKTLKRDGVCTASLPTTMAIISGLLVQHALKILLDFGKISGCVSYNALQDFFPTYPLAPNPACSNAVCQLRQKEYQEIIAAKITTTISSTTSTAAAPTHETNEWCIELSDQDTPLTTSSSSTAAAQPLRDEASLSLSSSDSAPNFHPPKAAASPKSETSDLASLKDRLKKQFQ